jgi:hypothetical protein
MEKTAYPTEPVRGTLQSFMIAATVLLPASLAPGIIVGLAFRCTLPTFYICLEVISALVLMVLCMWATHKRLYRGARSGMTFWPLLKYAVGSDEYRVFPSSDPWFDWLVNYNQYYRHRDG